MPPKKDPPKSDNFADIMFYLMCAYIFISILQAIFNYFFGSIGPVDSLWENFVISLKSKLWPVLKFLGTLIITGAIFGIFYSLKNLNKIRSEEMSVYGVPPKKSDDGAEPLKNPKWDRVIENINSPHSSDWKLAIIEADIMLDELLRASGYHGDSLGEMLKAVEKSDFLTIENAWEAHKVRNQIAHTGADYDMTEREAKRVISLFESVFKEFKII